MKQPLCNILLLSLALNSCSSTRSLIELPTLVINGKEQNKLIQDRTPPKYGIDSPEGCVAMGEISLNIETFGQDSLKGTARESGSHQALPFATVILISNKQEVLTLQTDIDGHFITRIPEGLHQIQIEYFGFRTLTVDLSNLIE